MITKSASLSRAHLAMLMALAMPSPAAAQAVGGACLGYGAMQQALLNGKARRLTEIRQNVQGDIVKADLCVDDGRLSYRVTVLTNAGQVRKVVLDANSGQFMYARR